MVHLRSIQLRKPAKKNSPRFPHTLPLFQNFPELELTAPVTILVGENGTGKSTLLEALACAIGSITVGSQSVTSDESLKTVREFSKHLRLTWNKRTRKGFFLRAEDFFGYARQMADMRQGLEQDLKNVVEDYKDRSRLATGLAKTPYTRELQSIRQRYGGGLDTRSHGESFIDLFQSRFVPDGLYLLDEPEAPLSPIRQLGFLSLLKQMTEQNAQFMISTHSPILMAFPGAQLLLLDGEGIAPIDFEQIEHVTFTRDFLNNRQAYLKHI